MYCSNCGKETPDNLKFCTYCGAKLEMPISDSKKTMEPVRNENTEVIAIIPIILMIILAALFLYKSFAMTDSNNDAFSLLNDSSEIIGVILHWGVAFAILAVCASGFFGYIQPHKDKALISSGSTLFSLGVILFIFKHVYSDWDWNDMSIIMYRVFGITYDSLAIFTIITGIVALVIGVVLSNYRK